MVRERETAEDLTQETFVKMHEGLDSYRPTLSFSPWIFKIANNTAVNHLKRTLRLKRKRLGTVTLDDSSYPSAPRKIPATAIPLADRSPSTPTPLDARALAPALEEALGRLSEQQRRCFVLREIEGRSYGYIAEFLDLPVGTVGWYIHRARKELKDKLGPLHDSLRARSSRTPA